MISPNSIIFIRQPSELDIKAKNLKIVFSDLIRASTRHRKGDIEFPMSLNALDTYLSQKGYDKIDYAFLPDISTQKELQTSRQYLPTIGLRGQEQYPVRDSQIWGINMMNYLQTPEFFFLLQ